MIRRAWVLAAVPLALMLATGAGLYLFPSWENTISLAGCVVLLASSAAVGVGVLVWVVWGCRRGRFRFWRADVFAASVLASLDILLPVGVVVLAWLLLRSLSGILMS
jgi:hypothetical protein